MCHNKEMKREKTLLNCCVCKNDFYPKSGSLKQKTCSRECGRVLFTSKPSRKKGKHYPNLWKAKIKKCKVCSSEFRAVSDTINRKQIYCSRTCWSKRGRKEIISNCLNCKKDFTRRCKRKFCSRECSFKYHVGEKARAYKHGQCNTDRNLASAKITKWRRAVFKRDEYTCQKCQEKKNIQAHHVIHWAKDKSKRFDIDNGLTLCIDCHGEVHNRNFRKRFKQKTCKECDNAISGKGSTGLCRSCSIKKSWIKRWEDFTGKKAVKI